jgi:multiple antibiotic resistance protein
MLADFALLALATFAALLPIANPVSTAPIFVALTRPFPPARRKQQMRMAAVYMAAVLLVALFAGTLILSFFGISLYALRLAGGLVIARIGFSMLQPTASPSQDIGDNVPHGTGDVAFTPLAMPLLSGPGSMAVTIGMATEAERPFEYLAVAIGILGVAFATWITFKSSGAILRLLGPTGLDAMTRVMGFLLIGIGVQFVLTAIYEAALDPLIIGPLVQMIRGI